MKNLYLILVTVSIILYILTMRGSLGNPTPAEIDYKLSARGASFESSQERSRYALILALAHERRFAIDTYASLGTPDVGRVNNHYYSFFPPGVSIAALPFYFIGSRLGIAQMAVFSVSTIFALLTMLLVAKFCHKLKMHWSVALFSALSFGFATNAWGYSVTLFAHLVSAYLLLAGLYLTFFAAKEGWLQAVLVWLVYGVAIWVDYPNIFIYLPILLLFMFTSMINLNQEKRKVTLTINFKPLLASLVFLFVIGAYGFYNYLNFGHPLILSNTLPRVKDLKSPQTVQTVQGTARVPSAQTAGAALNPRLMTQGLISFIISHDRGVLVYSPLVLLFFLGVGALKGQLQKVELGLLALPATCLVLYSMFGDPYGGWAFGSRYLIAILPELVILAGLGLQKFGHLLLVRIYYSFFFIYSAAVALLAPLTTNTIPPFVEARHFGLDSSFVLNWKMLLNNQLSSFFYNYILERRIAGVYYYFFVLSLLLLIVLWAIWQPKTKLYEITEA